MFKLRSLGYLVVGVDEFYTSKKCPCCQKFVGAVTMRRLYCPSCKKAYHRDVMAGHNIAKIADKQLTDFCRSGYLSADPTPNNKRKSISGPAMPIGIKDTAPTLTR